MNEKKVIEDYHILYNMDRMQLVRDALDYIDDGWTLQGGVSISQETLGTVFAQALILYAGDTVLKVMTND